jgi:hypothetical protein
MFIFYIYVADLAGFLSKNKDFIKSENNEKHSIAFKIGEFLLFFIAAYSLFFIFLWFYTIANIKENPVGYIALLFIFSLVIFDLLIVLNELNKRAMFIYTGLILNAVFSFMFLTLEAAMPNFFSATAHPFASLDFATSMPILPILFSLVYICMTIYLAVSLKNH